MKWCMYLAPLLVLLLITSVESSGSVEDVETVCTTATPITPAITTTAVAVAFGGIQTCPSLVCTCSVLLCVDPDQTVTPTRSEPTSTCQQFSANDAISGGDFMNCLFSNARINDLVDAAGIGTGTFALQATLITTDPDNSQTSATSDVQVVDITDTGVGVATSVTLTTSLGLFTVNIVSCNDGGVPDSCDTAIGLALSGGIGGDGGDDVDGVWSSWGEWSACGVTCGGGTRTRERACDSPSPANGGADCVGNSIEPEVCGDMPCPVDGVWSLWGEWSACGVTCGGGTRTRERACDSPSPANGGADCDGNSIEPEVCGDTPCPVASCPAGFTLTTLTSGDTCHLVVAGTSPQVSQTAARAACTGLAGVTADLVSIETNEEFTAIRALLSTTFRDSYRTGLQFDGTNAAWVATGETSVPTDNVDSVPETSSTCGLIVVTTTGDQRLRSKPCGARPRVMGHICEASPI